MNLEDIPAFEDIDAFSDEERKAIMVIRTGRNEDAPVELLIRNLFVQGILLKASDLYFVGKGDRQRPRVQISVRAPKQLLNYAYDGSRGLHFESKLFQLTATPQGGSTPEILSTRFSIELPARFARAHGLIPDGERPYLVDVRVEYIRTYDGWAFTCRLLDQQRAPKLHELGISYALRRAIDAALAQPSGLILVSGPTGSGKTTTLKAMLDELNDGQKSICTIENPVEYRLVGEGPIVQIPVRGDITFARALRSVLRHHPDTILVGEIRDQETMEIALQASQTGHLVFATLHANSASETVSRALDLCQDKRRDAFRLAETLKFVMAQRLLDRYEGVAAERDLHADEASWLEANGMGFIRRVREVGANSSASKVGKAAVFEAITMTPAVKDALRGEALNASDIYRLACDQPQYETLANAGVRAVWHLGCRLDDCLTRLETTTDAAAVPGYRCRLARDHGLTLVEVNEAIDALCRAEDEGRPGSIGDLMIDVKRGAAECAAVR